MEDQILEKYNKYRKVSQTFNYAEDSRGEKIQQILLRTTVNHSLNEWFLSKDLHDVVSKEN